MCVLNQLLLIFYFTGKIAMPTDVQHPMSALESQFCDTAILLHEEFHTSETLKEVTLRYVSD